MPDDSPDSSSSTGEQSMPLEYSPRILRRPISMPSGIVVPTVASGTRSPTAMLKAPHHTSTGSRSPRVDGDPLDLLGVGVLAQLEHPGHDDAVEALPEVDLVLDGHAEHGEVVGDPLDRRVDRREVAQPGQQDLHREASDRLVSPSTP